MAKLIDECKMEWDSKLFYGIKAGGRSVLVCACQQYGNIGIIFTDGGVYLMDEGDGSDNAVWSADEVVSLCKEEKGNKSILTAEQKVCIATEDDVRAGELDLEVLKRYITEQADIDDILARAKDLLVFAELEALN